MPPGFAASITANYPALEDSLNGIRDKFGIDPLVPSRIRAGLGVNYQEMIDASTQEIILAGQNLLGPIGRGTNPLPRLRSGHRLFQRPSPQKPVKANP